MTLCPEPVRVWDQIKDVVDNISAKLTDLTEKLDGASEEEMMDILVRFLGGDPDSLGAYFASPVTMETIAMYPVATYGSAMTPFYSTLAIWVGSTILVALVKVKASPKGLENVQSYQLYFGRYLLFFLLAQIQAAIIVAGDLWLLKVNIVEPGAVFPGGKLYGYGIFPVDLFSDTGIRRCGQGRLRYCYGIADRWFQRYLPDRTATGHLPEDLYFLSLPLCHPGHA